MTNMQIVDLPYIENIQDELILGSAGAIAVAESSAEGISPKTSTFTQTIAASLPKNGSFAVGFGFALAVGINPTAGVTVAGSGDIVTVANYSQDSKNVSVAAAIVVAIDLPSKKYL
jgi:hypothetical protein